jgi:hypothetical protein
MHNLAIDISIKSIARLLRLSKRSIFIIILIICKCSLLRSVRPLCMETPTNMLDFETNVLYNNGSFLFVPSFYSLC